MLTGRDAPARRPMMTEPTPSPVRTLVLGLTLAALAAPGIALAQPACGHESRCPEGQTWDEASGSCTVPMSS